jgi:hypothetical protein
MGMFDWVNYTATCDCGRSLRDFQSKDGPCQMLRLEPHQVEIFYTMCLCGLWNEYKVEAEVEVIVKSMDIRKVKSERMTAEVDFKESKEGV